MRSAASAGAAADAARSARDMQWPGPGARHVTGTRKEKRTVFESEERTDLRTKHCLLQGLSVLLHGIPFRCFKQIVEKGRRVHTIFSWYTTLQPSSGQGSQQNGSRSQPFCWEPPKKCLAPLALPTQQKTKVPGPTRPATGAGVPGGDDRFIRSSCA